MNHPTTLPMDREERERCFREGRELLYARRYFDCHEVWEELWRQSAGPQKQWLQGLIQAAVGFHHWQRGNWVGARRVWTRSLKNLRTAAPQLVAEATVPELQSCLEAGIRAADGDDLPAARLAMEALPAEG